jgi:TolB-like protein/tetratricopeptide (TPR) repeat protein
MDELARLQAALAGRYTIEHELGRGGMATVYLAQDLKHGRSIALKVLRPELATALGPGRFVREIEIAARLTHPNILPLHDSGEVDGFLYYVMPYVEGESLRSHLTREGPLPLDQALEITREVADALGYAHAHGVVHRDIKPDNILLESGHAVVSDFGIARAITAAAGDSLTETGLAVGSPAYMSPEQAGAEASIDGRSDIYALGCVMYEMLTGEPPFTGPTPRAVAAKHLRQSVPSVRVTRPGVPSHVDHVIRTALAKAPADRFPDAARFAAALAASDEPPKRRLFPRRWPGVVVAAALGLAAGRWAWGRWGGAVHDAPALAGPSRVVPDPRHVAVLYFETESDDHKVQEVANGLTQDLIDQLSQIDGLRVVSANGVRPYRDQATSLQRVAAALSVGTVIAGTVGGSPDRPLLVIRLIDPVTGQQLDSKRVAPGKGDVLALRDELIREVTLFLRERLGKEVRLHELRAGTRSPAAWLLVTRVEDARRDAAALYTAGDTAAAHHVLDTGDSLLRVAERLDPNWLDPIVLEGWVAVDRIDLAVGATAPAVHKWAPMAVAQAERVLARSPQYPPALELRGYARFLAWQYGGRGHMRGAADAERDLRAAAVPENPSQARAWSSLSSVLEHTGSFAEANLAAQRAYATDAFLAAAPSVLFRLYLTSLMLRRWKEAAEWCARGYTRFSTDWLFTFCRLSLLYEPSGQRPDPEAAWRLVAELERVIPPSERPVLTPRWRMLVAGILARAGQPDSARHTLEAARASGLGDPEMDYYEAGVHVLMRQHTPALDLLERYLGYAPQMKPDVERDPVFEPLHASPRFRALVAETRQ